MPPVVAALGAGLTAFSTAATAVGGAIAGAGLGSAFAQLAVGTALSALGQAVAAKQARAGAPRGVKLTATSGEDEPASFILGRYSTPGSLVYRGSHGGGGEDRSEVYVQVFELSDLPIAGLRRVMVNGAWCDLKSPADPDRGHPVRGYEWKGAENLWVKFYDGTQTEADAEMVRRFASDPVEPWAATAVGRGIPYAIVSSYYRPKVHAQVPVLRFEVDGVRLYDPRRDSSVGGAGPQRLGDRSTWTSSDNPAVQAYNVFLGIRHPLTGRRFWGAKEISARDIPLSDWVAAMNACDREIGGAPQYRAGLEVRVDEQPAAVLEELGKACQAQFSEVAGFWTMRVGAPSLPVYAIDVREDLVVSAPTSEDIFAGLEETWSGVRATYLSPAAGWETRDAPALDRPDLVEIDGGRPNLAEIKFLSVYDAKQARRLMRSALNDSRRMRGLVFNLPPDAMALAPLDTVSVTDPGRGFSAKLFEVVTVRDLDAGGVSVVLRERDPNDYDIPDDAIDVDDRENVRPPYKPLREAFTVSPYSIPAGGAGGYAPGILLEWSRRDGVDEVRYRVRLTSDKSAVVLSSSTPHADATASTRRLTLGGRPVRLGTKRPTFSIFADVDAGRAVISGRALKPATAYQVQPWYWPGGEPSRWYDVTTPDVRIGFDDLDAPTRGRIDAARDDAAAAAAAVLAIDARVDDVETAIGSLAPAVLAQAADLVAALEGLDGPAIANLSGVAIAGARKGGWIADPFFAAWSGGALTKWSHVGLAGNGALETGGAVPPTYATALRATLAAGASALELSAASDVAGQFLGVDLRAEFVVLGYIVRAYSGSLVGARLRVEWKQTAAGAWTAGNAFGLTNADGRLGLDYGVDVDPALFASGEVVWRRPFAGAAHAIRVVVVVKRPGDPAIDLRLEALNLYAATESDVKAFLAGGQATAQVDELRREIVGPNGAIAAAVSILETAYGPSVAAVKRGDFALSTDLVAVAGSVERMTTGFGGRNLVRNPDWSDGVRPAGQSPAWWTSWPAGFSIVARDPGAAASAVRSAPTPFVAAVAADAAQWQAVAVDRFPVKPGDKIKLEVAVAAGGSGGTGSLQFRLEFRPAPTAAPVQAATTRTRTVALAEGWVRPDFGVVTVPDLASEMRVIVRATAGRVGQLFFTQVGVSLGDPVSLAEIEEIKTTKVDKDGAIAALETTISAKYGTWDNFISKSETAIATAEGAASAYVIRTGTGGSFGIYSWANESGVGDAVRLDFDAIIAKGTWSASSAIIQEHGQNLIADNDMQHAGAWDLGSLWRLNKDAANDAASSRGEVRYIGTGGTDWANCDGPAFAVRPGQVLYFDYEVERRTGGAFTGGLVARFGNRSNGYVDAFEVGNTWSTTSSALLKREAVRIVVPDGAFLCTPRLRVLREETTGQVAFTGLRAVRRSKSSTVIEPDRVTTEEIFAEELIVGAINIRDGQIGRSLSGKRDQSFAVNAAAGWVNLLTLSVGSNWFPDYKDGSPRTARVTIAPATIYGTASSPLVGFRCLVGGNVVFSHDTQHGGVQVERSRSFNFVAPIQNGQNIQWQIREYSGEITHTETFMSATIILSSG